MQSLAEDRSPSIGSVRLQVSEQFQRLSTAGKDTNKQNRDKKFSSTISEDPVGEMTTSIDQTRAVESND